MIKHNNNRYKNKNYLSKLPRASDYRYYFSSDEFDTSEKIITISQHEWQEAISNLFAGKNILPNWILRIKDKSILDFLIDLGMCLTEYKITLIQTTHYPWGKKDLHIEDEWIFRNDSNVILTTSWWYLSSETSFCISHPTILNNKIFINIHHKKRHIQVIRTLNLIQAITKVYKIASYLEILDKFKHENIILELIPNSDKYDTSHLIYAEYIVLLNGRKFFLQLDILNQFYLLSLNNDYYDYICFNINYLSEYSFTDIYQLITEFKIVL